MVPGRSIANGSEMAKKNLSEWRCVTKTIFASCLVIAFWVCTLVVLTTNHDHVQKKIKNSQITLQEDEVKIGISRDGFYSKAAVSSDAGECSDIGIEVLKENGTVIDAAIATLLCLGVVNAQSMGVGGGFLMTYYNKSSRSSWSIDAREEAPRKANKTMFKKPHDSVFGGQAVAVPGELRGYEMAYQKGGKLPWKRLFDPTIKLCREGHKVNPHMAYTLNVHKKRIVKEQTMDIYWGPVKGKNKTVKKLGDIVTNYQLADTLELIAGSANNSADALYDGVLTADFVKDITEKGGIMEIDDLNEFRPREEDNPVVMKLANNRTLYTSHPPSSGVLIGFMILLLERLQTKLKDMTPVDFNHYLTEAIIFAYNFRNKLGDLKDAHKNVTKLIQNLTDPKFIDTIRIHIDNSSTHDPDYYGEVSVQNEDHGTSHLSIIGANGDAVVVTSTINLYFGAMFQSKSTGILLNNEMDDFSTPNRSNTFGLPPSQSNFIKPGKKPMSSMCPVIIVDDTSGDVILAIGGAGGSRITSAVMFTIGHHYFLGSDLRTSIDERRIHHQLYPNLLMTEKNFSAVIADGLRAKRHNVTNLTGWGAVVVGISRLENRTLHAVSDHRKFGYPSGY